MQLFLVRWELAAAPNQTQTSNVIGVIGALPRRFHLSRDLTSDSIDQFLLGGGHRLSAFRDEIDVVVDA